MANEKDNKTKKASVSSARRAAIKMARETEKSMRDDAATAAAGQKAASDQQKIDFYTSLELNALLVGVTDSRTHRKIRMDLQDAIEKGKDINDATFISDYKTKHPEFYPTVGGSDSKDVATIATQTTETEEQPVATTKTRVKYRRRGTNDIVDITDQLDLIEERLNDYATSNYRGAKLKKAQEEIKKNMDQLRAGKQLNLIADNYDDNKSWHIDDNVKSTLWNMLEPMFNGQQAASTSHSVSSSVSQSASSTSQSVSARDDMKNLSELMYETGRIPAILEAALAGNYNDQLTFEDRLSDIKTVLKKKYPTKTSEIDRLVDYRTISNFLTANNESDLNADELIRTYLYAQPKSDEDDVENPNEISLPDGHTKITEFKDLQGNKFVLAQKNGYKYVFNDNQQMLRPSNFTGSIAGHYIDNEGKYHYVKGSDSGFSVIDDENNGDVQDYLEIMNRALLGLNGYSTYTYGSDESNPILDKLQRTFQYKDITHIFRNLPAHIHILIDKDKSLVDHGDFKDTFVHIFNDTNPDAYQEGTLTVTNNGGSNQYAINFGDDSYTGVLTTTGVKQDWISLTNDTLNTAELQAVRADAAKISNMAASNKRWGGHWGEEVPKELTAEVDRCLKAKDFTTIGHIFLGPQNLGLPFLKDKSQWQRNLNNQPIQLMAVYWFYVIEGIRKRLGNDATMGQAIRAMGLPKKVDGVDIRQNLVDFLVLFTAQGGSVSGSSQGLYHPQTSQSDEGNNNEDTPPSDSPWSMKNGGVIKAMLGMQFQNLINNLADTSNAKLLSDEDLQALTAAYNEQLKQIDERNGRREGYIGGSGVSGHQWDGHDTADVVAGGLDLVSLVGGIPGIIASGAALLVDAFNQGFDDRYSKADVAKNIGINVAFMALSIIPGAKAGKFAKNASKAAKMLKNGEKEAVKAAKAIAKEKGIELSDDAVKQVIKEARNALKGEDGKLLAKVVEQNKFGQAVSSRVGDIINGVGSVAALGAGIQGASTAINDIQNGKGLSTTAARQMVGGLAGIRGLGYGAEKLAIKHATTPVTGEERAAAEAVHSIKVKGLDSEIKGVNGEHEFFNEDGELIINAKPGASKEEIKAEIELQKGKIKEAYAKEHPIEGVDESTAKKNTEDIKAFNEKVDKIKTSNTEIAKAKASDKYESAKKKVTDALSDPFAPDNERRIKTEKEMEEDIIPHFFGKRLAKHRGYATAEEYAKQDKQTNKYLEDLAKRMNEVVGSEKKPTEEATHTNETGETIVSDNGTPEVDNAPRETAAAEDWKTHATKNEDGTYTVMRDGRLMKVDENGNPIVEQQPVPSAEEHAENREKTAAEEVHPDEQQQAQDTFDKVSEQNKKKLEYLRKKLAAAKNDKQRKKVLKEIDELAHVGEAKQSANSTVINNLASLNRFRNQQNAAAENARRVTHKKKKHEEGGILNFEDPVMMRLGGIAQRINKYGTATGEQILPSTMSDPSFISGVDLDAFRAQYNTELEQVYKQILVDPNLTLEQKRAKIQEINDLFLQAYQLYGKSGYRTGTAITLDGTHDYQTAYDREGFHTPIFKTSWDYSAYSPLDTRDSFSDGVWNNGDNVYGLMTYNRVANLFTDEELKRQNDLLSGTGIKWVLDERAGSDDRQKGGRKFYKLVMDDDPDEEINTITGGGKTKKGDSSNKSGLPIDYTALAELPGLAMGLGVNAANYNTLAGIHAPNMPYPDHYLPVYDNLQYRQYAENEGRRYIAEAEKQAAQSANPALRQAIMFKAYDKAEQLAEKAAVTDLDIYNKSIDAQVKNEENYATKRLDAKYKNDLIDYKNRLGDAQLAAARNLKDYESLMAYNDLVATNLDLDNQVAISQHNAEIQAKAELMVENAKIAYKRKVEYAENKENFEEVQKVKKQSPAMWEKSESFRNRTYAQFEALIKAWHDEILKQADAEYQAAVKAAAEYIDSNKWTYGHPFYIDSNRTGISTGSTETSKTQSTTGAILTPVKKTGGQLSFAERAEIQRQKAVLDMVKQNIKVHEANEKRRRNQIDPAESGLGRERLAVLTSLLKGEK